MLTVSSDGRYLLKNGMFFPYLADTAWTLLQRLTREEICLYLNKRQEQGFNAVQISAVSELDGLRIPNRENQLPFQKADPAQPNEAYFSLVHFVAGECQKRDMVTVLLPTWGDKFNRKWGIGPEVFTPQNALEYGRYLARLLRGQENIIWMLGGDRPIETSYHRKIIDAMADGLRSGEEVRHLITYHPCGEASSTDYLADADYIDFHSFQSGHSFGGFQSEKMAKRILSETDKPVLDAECFYEDFPVDFDLRWNFRFSEKEIRRRIYRNMMAGVLGHTYGHQSVWCFRDRADEEYCYHWKDALTRPMAEQMKNINVLLKRVRLPGSRLSSIARNAPARETEDGFLIYAEDPSPVFLDLSALKSISLCWFNPVSGNFTPETMYRKECLTIQNPCQNEAVCLIYKK